MAVIILATFLCLGQGILTRVWPHPRGLQLSRGILRDFSQNGLIKFLWVFSLGGGKGLGGGDKEALIKETAVTQSWESL